MIKAKAARSPALTLPSAMDLLVRREIHTPVVTDYGLAILLFNLLSQGELDGKRLRGRARRATRRDLSSIKGALISRGVLEEDRSLPRTVLRLTGQTHPDPGEILCAIDPFGYLSHLSAMVYHGLTNRLPKILFFTSPTPSEWKQLAQVRMARDIGSNLSDYRASNLPLLRRHKIERIHGLTINLVYTKNIGGGFRNTKEGLLRVSTLGRTYLDMLRRSELCGGMSHVIDVFEQNASSHLPLILNEIDQQGAKIDRVRAGYILEERCGLSDPRIDAWTKVAQRGGSQRLDPHAEYAPNFSERWMLSINV